MSRLAEPAKKPDGEAAQEVDPERPVGKSRERIHPLHDAGHNETEAGAEETSGPNEYVDFIALSSYEGQATSTTGAVRFIMDLRAPLRGQHVLVVEDILDTGYTLDYLLRALGAREPASLKTCVLLQKPDRIEVPVEIDYLGFSIPNEWVVGYGLDYNDLFRTLPYIGVIDPKL